jgi:FkbM family methyltransferase
MLLKYRKALFSLLRPQLWPALANGVAASIEHHAALADRPFKSIIDVGANRGQFVLFARMINRDATIVAFEPLEAPRRVCERLFARDPRVIIKDVAIGASQHGALMFVAAKDDSSSLLAVGGVQHEVFGTTAQQTSPVQVRRLEDCIAAEDLASPALLKIDVQGGELDVLRGAESLLNGFAAIYVECSYVPLYEGQALASDVIAFLAQRGFSIAGVFNQHEHWRFGPVQADFLFVRTERPEPTVTAGLRSNAVAA